MTDARLGFRHFGAQETRFRAVFGRFGVVAREWEA